MEREKALNCKIQTLIANSQRCKYVHIYIYLLVLVPCTQVIESDESRPVLGPCSLKFFKVNELGSNLKYAYTMCTIEMTDDVDYGVNDGKLNGRYMATVQQREA